MRQSGLYDFAAVLTRTALFFACAMFFLLGYTPEAETIWCGIAIFAGAELLFYGMRKKVKSPAVFILLHVLVVTLAWGITPQTLKIAYTVGILALLADSFYCRLRLGGTGEYSIHWGPAGLLVLLYIVGAFYGMTFFCTVCFYATVCFLFGWILQTGLLRTQQFIEDSKDMANLPAKKIRAQAGGILAVFAGGVMAAMIAAPKTVLMQFLEWGRKGVLFLLGKLLGMVHITAPTEIPEVEQTDMGKVFRGGLFAKEDVRLPIWDILDNIVFIIMYTALFCAFAALVIFVVRKLKILFSVQTEQESDITERIVPESVQRFSLRRRNLARNAAISGAPESVKVRKLYKKYMMTRAERHLRPSVTPKELENAISSPEEVRRLYEKARYSMEGADKQDVERMKSVMKQ